MRYLFSSLAALFVVGCAHRSASAWVTQQQLTQFTDTALAALHSEQGIRLPSGFVSPTVGEYDNTKPIRYWMQDGSPPKVFVHIPTQSAAHSFTHSYIEFTFDASSAEILAVSHGLIHSDRDSHETK